MRFTIELGSDGDGKVAGSVIPEGGRPRTFTGWLELLRLLEPGPHGDGVEPPPATSDAADVSEP